MSANPLQHVLRAHLQGKRQTSKPITNFGWVALCDKCQCNARGKQCSTKACSCHKQHLACTSYCNCSGGYDCCNPHYVGKGTQAEEAGENIDAEDEDYEEDPTIKDAGPVKFVDPDEFEF